MSEVVKGILKRTKKGAGVLRQPERSLKRGTNEVFAPSQLIQKYRLVDGVSLQGSSIRMGKRFELKDITAICDISPEEFLKRTPYQQLIAVNPMDRFHLALSGLTSMRVLDLVAPVGRGTRGLIVSPPQAGKTTLLEQIAQSLCKESQDVRVIVFLIDERPEEVTSFRRSVSAEVFASSSDQSVDEHIELSELVLAHVRSELECGRDVVVLVDSITRMGRAFNIWGKGKGRTMSGGLESRALEIPRRFFGMARNIENGGSVTIIATALIDTNSRMDQLIFEEFKGTGNSEIVLDRSLAEERIFPAINISASGTRREELLYSPEQMKKITALRRMMAGQNPKDAMLWLLKRIGTYPSNDELLENLPE